MFELYTLSSNISDGKQPLPFTSELKRMSEAAKKWEIHSPSKIISSLKNLKIADSIKDVKDDHSLEIIQVKHMSSE